MQGYPRAAKQSVSEMGSRPSIVAAHGKVPVNKSKIDSFDDGVVIIGEDVL